MTWGFKNSTFHQMSKNNETRSLPLSRECKGIHEMEAKDSKVNFDNVSSLQHKLLESMLKQVGGSGGLEKDHDIEHSGD